VGEQKERMLRGDLYRYDDPDLRADHVRAQLLLERFNATGVMDVAERRELLEELLGHIGDDVEIKPPFRCDYGLYTRVGAGTFVNYGAIFLDCAPITIGRDVQIATNVQLLTATHPLEAGPRREGWESAHPIALEDGVWLGGGVIVCPGVTIGANTVVGAGSVVLRDLPPDVLAVGNPSRAVRELG
jgi:maltose O-acetyltransferase